jgi:ACS family tartrate transporter-like MFS transporter
MVANPGGSLIEARTIRQVAWRIVPFLMVCYFVSFVDRVNVGFAALQMNKELHLSPAVFGFGGGLFFLSYFLCEVPSNLLLQKIGASRWIARIMISWGVLAAGMALVTGPRSFYAMRRAPRAWRLRQRSVMIANRSRPAPAAADR